MAQELSKSHNSMTMEIADSIASLLSATSGDIFNVKIVPPGWLSLELTNSFLATWLQNLAIACAGKDEIMDIGENPNRKLNFKDPHLANLFVIQYVCARCYSLLRLAHREGLIRLTEASVNSPRDWQLEFPQPIPWLDNNNQLRLNHPTEGYLISQLVQIVDDLVFSDVSNSINWQQAALELSRAFENFWSQCRIWGEVKIASPELAQARLGLIMATGCLLQVLLVKKLDSFAPWEL